MDTSYCLPNITIMFVWLLGVNLHVPLLFIRTEKTNVSWKSDKSTFFSCNLSILFPVPGHWGEKSSQSWPPLTIQHLSWAEKFKPKLICWVHSVWKDPEPSVFFGDTLHSACWIQWLYSRSWDISWIFLWRVLL